MIKAPKGFGIFVISSALMFLLLPLSINSEIQNSGSQEVRSITKSFDFSTISMPLDSLFNIKINSDVTTQIQNEEQVVINPLGKDTVVAVWRDFSFVGQACPQDCLTKMVVDHSSRWSTYRAAPLKEKI